MCHQLKALGTGFNKKKSLPLSKIDLHPETDVVAFSLFVSVINAETIFSLETTAEQQAQCFDLLCTKYNVNIF